MAMQLTPWAYIWFAALLISLYVLIIAGRYLIKCNLVTGFIEVSDESKARARNWLKRRGGYNPEAHSGAVYAVITSGILCVLLIIIPLLILLARSP